MTKVYVAGSSKEMDRVRAFQNAIIECGFEIVLDWTKSVDEERANGWVTYDMIPPTYRTRCADADAQAVTDADVNVFLAPTTGWSNMWIELGIAIAHMRSLRKRVLIVGGESAIFSFATGVDRVDTDAAAVKWLRLGETYGAFTLYHARSEYVHVSEVAQLESQVSELRKLKTIDDYVTEICAWAAEKGWDQKLCETKARVVDDQHDGGSVRIFEEPTGVNVDAVLSKVALIHSEVSEGTEHVRDGNYTIFYTEDKKGRDKPDGLVVELADAFIRICHLAGDLGLPLQEAIEQKLAYNQKRPYRHGGRLA